MTQKSTSDFSDHLKCPTCGYRIHSIEFIYARFDYYCPRCRVDQLSNFEVVETAELNRSDE